MSWEWEGMDTRKSFPHISSRDGRVECCCSCWTHHHRSWLAGRQLRQYRNEERVGSSVSAVNELVQTDRSAASTAIVLPATQSGRVKTTTMTTQIYDTREKDRRCGRQAYVTGQLPSIAYDRPPSTPLALLTSTDETSKTPVVSPLACFTVDAACWFYWVRQ